EVEFVEQGGAFLFRAPLRRLALESGLGFQVLVLEVEFGLGLLGRLQGVRLGPERVAVASATPPTSPSSLPLELAHRGCGLIRGALDLRLDLRFELGGEIGPARGGEIGTGGGVGLAGTLAAGDIARLARAIMGASRALAGRFRFRSPGALE